MSGKVIVAVVAAAVSSASAATVGVVYKKMVEPKPIEVSAPVSETGPSTGPVRSAVVLNASDSLFGFLADSTGEGDLTANSISQGDPTACRGRAGCVMVARASDRRVNILGSATTIPPFWLGGDSRDFYAFPVARGLASFEEQARIIVRSTHGRPKTGTLGLEPQSDDGSAHKEGGDSGRGRSFKRLRFGPAVADDIDRRARVSNRDRCSNVSARDPVVQRWGIVTSRSSVGLVSN